MADAVTATIMPLAAAEFEQLMIPFAPYEERPRLAVACSGGGDSMALAFLADRWAHSHRGILTALIVDHRLRPESSREAESVVRALAMRGVAHCVLVRTGELPAGNLEDAARRTRYTLLEGWCEEHGVLHLLTAHHRDDQAETLLMRLARGSGLDGLAGIGPETTRHACRILRPLLGIAPERLRATLREFGVGHVEDPMNHNQAFQRVRFRAAREILDREGLSAAKLAGTAERLARVRAVLDRVVADALAGAVALDPCGFARVDIAVLKTMPQEIGLRVLSAVLMTVGGADYSVRLERLERLYRELPDGVAGGRTLGGCHLIPLAGRILVCREPAAVEDRVEAPPGERLHWDGRFAIVVPTHSTMGLMVAAVGTEGAARLATDGFGIDIRAVVRATLPALYDADGLAAVPLLGWRRVDVSAALASREIAVFSPLRPLSGLGLTVV